MKQPNERSDAEHGEDEERQAHLRAIAERTKALEPSAEFVARLIAIPSGQSGQSTARERARGGGGPLFAAIANYALPSFALAAAAAILLAVSTPGGDASFDDDLASIATVEISP